MDRKIKKRFVFMWISIGVAIAVQIVGWIPTIDLLSRGDLDSIGGLIAAILLLGTGALTAVPVVLAVIETVRKKTPTIGSIRASAILLTLALYTSFISTLLGASFVGKDEAVFICCPICIVVSILYIVSSIKAKNVLKQAALQNQYLYHYQYQDVSDEINFTTNGKPLQ